MRHNRLILMFAATMLCPYWTGPVLSSEAANDFRPKLVTVQLTSTQVRPGDPVSFTLQFRNVGTTVASTDYRVFTHFEAPRKSCENIVVHADHVAAEPTTLWTPGQLVVDGPYSYTVPADAAEGDYYIHVGLFDFGGTGERVLDVYSDKMVQVSRSAPSVSSLSPEPLASEELARRRQALHDRISSQNCCTLNTKAWQFDVDRSSGAWSLLDKATNVLWTSNPVQPRFGRILLQNGDKRLVWRIDRFDNVESTPRSLRLITRPTLDGQPIGITLVVAITPLANSNGLQVAYVSHSASPWQVVSARLLEEAFEVTDNDQGSLYVPYRLGIELPADSGLPGNQTYTTYDNLSMSMCGAVKQQSALLISWFDVDSHLTVHTTWPDQPLVPGRRARSISLELSGPTNGCVIEPLGKGDYVTIAKAYRTVAQQAGWRRTWAEKRRQFPTVDRIFGAADFKPFVFSRVVPSSVFSRDGKEHTSLGFTFDEAAACAEHWRHDLQIDRAFVVLAGWINGGYDVRHPDVLPAAPECGGNEELIKASKRIRDCGYLFGLHDNYQDMYEDAPSFGQEWLNKDKQGVAKKGGNWNGGQAWQVCAIKQVELAARKDTNLPAIAKLFQPTIYFIDTVFAWPLVTCEDPAHPMTRHDDLLWKSKLCLLAKQYFGLFGSEEGREWAVPCADYLEGIFGHQTDSAPGEVIPLFPLVYSDCVQIMTHQGNRIGPGDEKKVADHILFAEMFLPRFGSHRYWENAEPNTVPIMPLEPIVKRSGNRQFQITYRWKALQSVPEDYSIFVHFTNPKASRSENIAFQNDHRPPVPTSQWKAGEIVEDGPHTVDVPDGFADQAQIQVGMLKGGERVLLTSSTRQRLRYTVGRLVISDDKIEVEGTSAGTSRELWSRGDDGWGQDLCRTDRVIKNVWEVLSPLNQITAELPLDDHRFLTPDRLVQQTRFGDVVITVAYEKNAQLGDNVVPPYGFIVESPQFVAFCATRYNGVDYASPTLFTARSLDGKPLQQSGQVRVFHGFGDPRIRLGGKTFDVAKEAVVSMN